MTGRVKWGQPGSRVARKTTALVRDRGLRKVVVCVYPDGIIGLRAEGTRKEEVVDAAWLWYEAVKRRVANERAAKRAAKKGAKK
jgi:(2Fe-2S) ferredoxin